MRSIVHEIIPGVWQWRTVHPEWLPDEGWDPVVASHATVTGGRLVLIDPMLPIGDDPVWDWIAAAAAGRNGVPVVLVTSRWHGRSARDVRERFGAVVWAADPSADALAGVDVVGGLDAPLPVPAITAIPAGDPSRPEVLLHLTERRALVAGDVLHGDGEGGLSHAPSGWTGHDPLSRTWLSEGRRSLRPLASLDIEHVLVSHGEPVLHSGRDALRRLLLDIRV